MSLAEKEQKITCIVCPVGCDITVRGSGDQIKSVEGCSCNRGIEYAKTEFTHPSRILTTTVKIDGGKEPLLPVRTKEPIPKELLLDCMDVIKKVRVQAPVNRYDVIIKNILNTGIDIVATATVPVSS